MSSQGEATQTMAYEPLSEIEDHPHVTRLLGEIRLATTRGRMPFISLLGPQGSGKSEILRDFLETLPKCSDLKTRGLLVDLRRLPIHQEEQMYAVLLESLQEAARQANLPSKPLEQALSLGRQFLNTVFYYLSNTTNRLFLCFDHLDCVPRHFARSLLRLLREMRDQVDVRDEYKRLGVVVAGALSLFELRQDYTSPFISGSPLTLPLLDIQEQQMLVKRYLAQQGIPPVDTNCLQLLAKFTGGERMFLEPLVQHLQKVHRTDPLSYRNLELMLENPDILFFPGKGFWSIAVQLLEDIELRRIADDLVNDRLTLKTMNPGSEIDRIQLSGLAVVVSNSSTSGYRLRSPFLKVSLSPVLDLLDGRRMDRSDQFDMIRDLKTLHDLRSHCLEVVDLESAAKVLFQMWSLLTGYSCAMLYIVARHQTGRHLGCFEYSDDRLVPVQVVPDEAGPLGWIAEHILDKSSSFVGADSEFLYAVCKTTRRTLETSIAVVLPRSTHQGAFSEVFLSHWFNFVKSFKARLALLASQEIVEMVEKNETKTRGGKNVSDTRKVFVVHGRNTTARDSMFSFLRSIGLEPLEWNKVVLATGSGTPSIFEIVDKGFSMAQAAVVLLTGDDEVRLRREFRSRNESEQETRLAPQPRANVLYEAGMAMGRYPDRTILIEIGQVKLFSDISVSFGDG